jgi:hypothetical protein
MIFMNLSCFCQPNKLNFEVHKSKTIRYVFEQIEITECGWFFFLNLYPQKSRIVMHEEFGGGGGCNTVKTRGCDGVETRGCCQVLFYTLLCTVASLVLRYAVDEKSKS